MSLGSGVIPWVECPKCGYVYLGISKCSECGLSWAEAKVEMNENLCICSAMRYEPADGSEGWNLLHEKGSYCVSGEQR